MGHVMGTLGLLAVAAAITITTLVVHTASLTAPAETNATIATALFGLLAAAAAVGHARNIVTRGTGPRSPGDPESKDDDERFSDGS